jgi:hypothetical protein
MSQAVTEPTEPTSKPLKSPRLVSLEEKKAALEKQIAALQAREKSRTRKDDTRTKIIVGAAILANINLHPETRARIVPILNKAVTAPRDRELLTARGLL